MKLYMSYNNKFESSINNKVLKYQNNKFDSNFYCKIIKRYAHQRSSRLESNNRRIPQS